MASTTETQMRKMAQRQANISQETWVVIRDVALTQGDEEFFVVPERGHRHFMERARWNGTDPVVILVCRAFRRED